MENEIPFACEYAKSDRSSCKKCKGKIAKDSVRMAIMVQSHMFDGRITLWHHVNCFFEKKNNLKSVAEIANFNNLRWDDQEKIKAKMAGDDSSASGSSKNNKEFSVEYAKSSRAACRKCATKIEKDEIRISKFDTEGEDAQRFGGIPRWYHVDCFASVREELEFFDKASSLPGYKKMKKDDMKLLDQKLIAIVKKRKAEEDISPPAKVIKSVRKEVKILKEQNQLLFDMRDKLKELSKKEMTQLLEFNKQYVPIGESRILDHLSDCLVFGAIQKCPDCKNATPRFKVNIYMCPGDITEWTKCIYETKYPTRTAFKIPQEFKEDYEFLKDYVYVKRDRCFPEDEIATKTKKNIPLTSYKIAVIGTAKTIKADNLVGQLQELGATVTKDVTPSTDVCIASPGDLKKKNAKITKAQNNNIHVVSSEFIEAVRKGSPVAFSIKETLLSTWGDDPVLKFGIKQEKTKEENVSGPAASSQSSSTSGSKTMKIQVKGPAAVHEESGLGMKAHVYQKGKDVYNVVLNSVDISRGTNSYYKMQILESNKGQGYWLSRAWGRVGTSIGSSKAEKMDLEEAIDMFEDLYLQKSGNHWFRRANFVKKPGCMFPIDLDYGQEETKNRVSLKADENSKLERPLQNLICLIFDIEAMKKAMVEFEIDLNKMPLGKLSKKQIEMAYKVLTDAQEILRTGSNKVKVLDVTNRFFTLIPHDFGMKKLPLLDDEEMIKMKIEMLDSLLEIEIAYNLLKDDSEDSNDPVYQHYRKLKTDIEILGKRTNEYEIIEKYMQNTHASTHDMYTLKLLDVFKIKREGEEERYSKKFNKLHNKKLLWHGSRVTNFVGILSQGLRIAPPEAPATGYMFGKGIYFADMVSKSANYCFTNKRNHTGILLLCEVALGNMYERPHSEYVVKLPKNMHSTKGLGMTIPDSAMKTQINGVEVPYGKPVPSNLAGTSLLYNEYIVYDINQVNIKYLLKVDFKYKY